VQQTPHAQFRTGLFIEAALAMNGRTVLVVDDEPLVRWSVSETLRDSGYRVTQAADAWSAMQAVEVSGRPTDVVLLDLQLPDADDLTVLSAMHAVSPATQIILITAYGTKELSIEARKRGAFDVLNKPFDMSAVAPMVARAIESRCSARL
jgi:DNA-binding NtrC family response regulator